MVPKTGLHATDAIIDVFATCFGGATNFHNIAMDKPQDAGLHIDMELDVRELKAGFHMERLDDGISLLI